MQKDFITEELYNKITSNFNSFNTKESYLNFLIILISNNFDTYYLSSQDILDISNNIGEKLYNKTIKEVNSYIAKSFNIEDIK